eukprot:TRINITY_DN2273_c0_g1_i1.p2 TRINITY_DN2273_c0_g1~~TRINITY_DN2273_c0_g1_i1.p2  ORF type:complete len:160 (-),score=25.11 TRINITY_DN2273_c0_g1_i1:90-569(-)
MCIRDSLIDNEQVITESRAVAEYIVLRAGCTEMIGKTWQEQVTVTQLVGLLEEVDGYLYIGCTEDNYIEILKKNIKDKALKKLKGVSQFLAEKEWLMGYFTIADAYLFFVEDFILTVDEDALNDFPNLIEHRKRFHNIQEVKDYHKSDRFVSTKFSTII